MTPNPAESPTSVALWSSVLGAPALWAIQLQVGYALAPATCHLGTRLPLYLLTLICITLALTGCALSYRDWKRAGGGSPDETDGGPIARLRFLGALGVIVGLTFAMVMLAQGLASFFFDPCWS